MAYKQRINPKTGEVEFKVRYYFFADGKKRDSETAWFDNLKDAEKEADRLKKAKETADKRKIASRRDKKISTLLDEFHEYCLDKYRKNPINNNRKLCKQSSGLPSHTPKDILNYAVKDVDEYLFKRWIVAVDNTELAGGTIHNYKGIIKKFNQYLSIQGYYLDVELENKINYVISTTKIKSLTVGNKEKSGKRNVVSILDFMKITYYYYDAGLEYFHNFYYYTMFYVLFFGGMRVEELMALQWKHVDLRDDKRIITICNAISVLEETKNALKRLNTGVNLTKNESSIRLIPIFDFYYDLLLDYQESYMYQYNLSKEELKECFVFPRVFSRKRENPHLYLDECVALKELHKVCKDRGIKHTDLQMFRHSCATFLILPPPNGLGYTESKVKDYFGHSDDSMLEKVYAKLNTIQKADRMRDTFKDIFKPEEDIDRAQEIKAKEELINRIRGDNAKKEKARKLRIFAQIKKVYADGRREYFYRQTDKYIIDEFIQAEGAGYADMAYTQV